MKQLQRITTMENVLEEIQQTLLSLAEVLEKYSHLQGKIQILSNYYGSNEWKQDYADDEQGKLPTTLKRGVLSEDGIWNVLQKNKELLHQMKEITENN